MQLNRRSNEFYGLRGPQRQKNVIIIIDGVPLSIQHPRQYSHRVEPKESQGQLFSPENCRRRRSPHLSSQIKLMKKTITSVQPDEAGGMLDYDADVTVQSGQQTCRRLWSVVPLKEGRKVTSSLPTLTLRQLFARAG